jgi:hypothetical protein
VNYVAFLKNSVTIFRSLVLNLVSSKNQVFKMKKLNDKLKQSDNQSDKKDKSSLPGYPKNPDSEDIYANFQEEEEINPEDTSNSKEPNSNNTSRRKSLDDLQSEKDLDIPGSELDDQQENIGSEDEENNYYSLGGDDHLDL